MPKKPHCVKRDKRGACTKWDVPGGSVELRGLGSPTKKDFQATATILCAHLASDDMVNAFANYFRGENPNFRGDLFKKAAFCRK